MLILPTAPILWLCYAATRYCIVQPAINELCLGISGMGSGAIPLTDEKSA